MKTKENILLDEIEASEEYEAFRALIEDTLQDQWLDIVSSGVVEDIFEEIGGPIKKGTTSPIRRLINRWIASGAVKDYSKIQRWVVDKVSGRIKRVGQYPGYGMAAKTYLYKIFNRGGQEELNRYLGVGVVDFKLTHKLLARKMRERADTLYKDWSKTTAQKFATQLIHGIRDGENRNQIVNRLVGLNEGIARNRAEMIVRTETTAAVEYMRYMTARMNGAEWKIWWATLDERTSQICRNTNGEEIPIDAIFSCGCEQPPAHVNCRSHVEYLYEPLGTEKAKKKVYQFYQKEKDLVFPKGLNPEYIWTGGEGYKGKDRDMDKYLLLFSKEDYKEFTRKELDTMAEKVKGYQYSSYFDINEFRREILDDSSLPWTDKINYTGMSNSKLSVVMARAKLTEIGFNQLIRKL